MPALSNISIPLLRSSLYGFSMLGTYPSLTHFDVASNPATPCVFTSTSGSGVQIADLGQITEWPEGTFINATVPSHFEVNAPSLTSVAFLRLQEIFYFTLQNFQGTNVTGLTVREATRLIIAHCPHLVSLEPLRGQGLRAEIMSIPGNTAMGLILQNLPSLTTLGGAFDHVTSIGYIRLLAPLTRLVKVSFPVLEVIRRWWHKDWTVHIPSMPALANFSMPLLRHSTRGFRMIGQYPSLTHFDVASNPATPFVIGGSKTLALDGMAALQYWNPDSFASAAVFAISIAGVGGQYHRLNLGLTLGNTPTLTLSSIGARSINIQKSGQTFTAFTLKNSQTEVIRVYATGANVDSIKVTNNPFLEALLWPSWLSATALTFSNNPRLCCTDEEVFTGPGSCSGLNKTCVTCPFNFVGSECFDCKCSLGYCKYNNRSTDHLSPECACMPPPKLVEPAWEPNPPTCRSVSLAWSFPDLMNVYHCGNPPVLDVEAYAVAHLDNGSSVRFFPQTGLNSSVFVGDLSHALPHTVVETVTVVARTDLNRMWVSNFTSTNITVPVGTPLNPPFVSNHTSHTGAVDVVWTYNASSTSCTIRESVILFWTLADGPGINPFSNLTLPTSVSRTSEGHAITGLAPSTNYSVSVGTYDKQGHLVVSEPKLVTTLSVALPTIPILNPPVINGASVILSWAKGDTTEVVDSWSIALASVLASEDLEMGANVVTPQHNVTLSVLGSRSSVVLSGQLHFNTTYDVSIQARNAAGVSTANRTLFGTPQSASLDVSVVPALLYENLTAGVRLIGHLPLSTVSGLPPSGVGALVVELPPPLVWHVPYRVSSANGATAFLDSNDVVTNASAVDHWPYRSNPAMTVYTIGIRAVSNVTSQRLDFDVTLHQFWQPMRPTLPLRVRFHFGNDSVFIADSSTMYPELSSRSLSSTGSFEPGAAHASGAGDRNTLFTTDLTPTTPIPKGSWLEWHWDNSFSIPDLSIQVEIRMPALSINLVTLATVSQTGSGPVIRLTVGPGDMQATQAFISYTVQLPTTLGVRHGPVLKVISPEREDGGKTLLARSVSSLGSVTISATPICGDGVRDPLGTEGCDDGNTRSGDGCSSACTIEPFYACEGTPSRCNSTSVCGDGKLQLEECDDGNIITGDGCSASCRIEQGWKCTSQPTSTSPSTCFAVVPGSPRAVVLTPVSESTDVRLTWEPPTETGRSDWRYLVSLITVNGTHAGNVTDYTALNSTASFTFRDLEPVTAYFARITARNTHGTSPAVSSNVVTTMTGCSVACDTSLHGHCNLNLTLCQCDDHWSGPDCSLYTEPYLACPLNCSSHGACNTTYGVCTCHTGWSGPACSVLAGRVCSANPLHSGPANCTCLPGFGGPNCDSTVDVRLVSGRIAPRSGFAIASDVGEVLSFTASLTTVPTAPVTVNLFHPCVGDILLSTSVMILYSDSGSRPTGVGGETTAAATNSTRGAVNATATTSPVSVPLARRRVDLSISSVVERVKDGDKTCPISAELTSLDPSYHGLVIPALATVFNKDVRFPVIMKIAPSTCSLSGCTLTLTGQYMGANPRCEVRGRKMRVRRLSSPRLLQEGLAIEQTSIVDPANGTALITVDANISTTPGYANVRLSNGEGASVSSPTAFYFDLPEATACQAPKAFIKGICSDCPPRATCLGGTRIEPKPGTIVDTETGESYDCLPAERCQGYNPATNSVLCGDGYEGVTCGTCGEGFFESNGSCLPCQGGKEIFVILIIVYGTFFVLLLLCLLFMSSAAMSIMVEALLSLQLLCTLGAATAFNLPQILKDTYSYLTLLSFNSSFLRRACATGRQANFPAVFLTNGALFAGVFVFVTLLGLLRRKLAAGKVNKAMRMDRLLRAQTVLVAVFFVLLTSQALQIVYCVDFAGDRVLAVNMTDVCSQGLHVRAYYIAYLVLAMVAFMILGSLYVVSRPKEWRQEPRHIERFGYMYESCKERDRYTTVVFFALLFAQNVFNMLFARDLLPKTLSICGTLLVMILWLLIRRPFVETWENFIVALSFSISATSTWCGYASATGLAPDFTHQLSRFIVALSGILILIWIVALIYYFIKLGRERRALKRTAHDTLMSKLSMKPSMGEGFFPVSEASSGWASGDSNTSDDHSVHGSPLDTNSDTFVDHSLPFLGVTDDLFDLTRELSVDDINVMDGDKRTRLDSPRSVSQESPLPASSVRPGLRRRPPSDTASVSEDDRLRGASALSVISDSSAAPPPFRPRPPSLPRQPALSVASVDTVDTHLTDDTLDFGFSYAFYPRAPHGDATSGTAEGSVASPASPAMGSESKRLPRPPKQAFSPAKSEGTPVRKLHSAKLPPIFPSITPERRQLSDRPPRLSIDSRLSDRPDPSVNTSVTRTRSTSVASDATASQDESSHGEGSATSLLGSRQSSSRHASRYSRGRRRRRRRGHGAVPFDL